MAKTKIPMNAISNRIENTKQQKFLRLKNRYQVRNLLRDEYNEVEWTRKLQEKFDAGEIHSDLYDAWEASSNDQEYKDSLGVPLSIRAIQELLVPAFLPEFKKSNYDFKFFTIVPMDAEVHHSELSRKHTRRVVGKFGKIIRKIVSYEFSANPPKGNLFVVSEASPHYENLSCHLHVVASGDWIHIVQKTKRMAHYRPSATAKKPWWAKKPVEADSKLHLLIVLCYMLKFRTYEKRAGVNDGHPIKPDDGTHIALLNHLHILRLDDAIRVDGQLKKLVPEAFHLSKQNGNEWDKGGYQHRVRIPEFWEDDFQVEEEIHNLEEQCTQKSGRTGAITEEPEIKSVAEMCGNMWEQLVTVASSGDTKINGLKTVLSGSDQNSRTVYGFCGNLGTHFSASQETEVLLEIATSAGAKLHSPKNKNAFRTLLDNSNASFTCFHIDRREFYQRDTKSGKLHTYVSPMGWIAGDLSDVEILTHDNICKEPQLPPSVSQLPALSKHLSELLADDPVLLVLFAFTLFPLLQPIFEEIGGLESSILDLYSPKEWGKTRITSKFLDLVYGSGGWHSGTWNTSQAAAEQLFVKCDKGVLLLDEVGLGGPVKSAVEKFKFVAHAIEKGECGARHNKPAVHFDTSVISTSNLKLIENFQKFGVDLETTDAVFSRLISLDFTLQNSRTTVNEKLELLNALVPDYSGLVEALIAVDVIGKLKRGEAKILGGYRDEFENHVDRSGGIPGLSNRQLRRFSALYSCLALAEDLGILDQAIIGDFRKPLRDILALQESGVPAPEEPKPSVKNLARNLLKRFAKHSGIFVQVKDGKLPKINNKQKNKKIVIRKRQDGGYKFVFSSSDLVQGVVPDFEQIKQQLYDAGLLLVNRSRGWKNKERYRQTDTNQTENAYVFAVDDKAFQKFRKLRKKHIAKAKVGS